MDFLIISMFFFVVSTVWAKYQPQTTKTVSFSVVIVFLHILFYGIFVVADYFTGEGINDAVIYHLSYGLGGAGFKEYYMIVFICIFFFVLSIVASYIYYWRIKRCYPTDAQYKARGRVSTLLLLAAFIFNPTTTSLYAHLKTLDSLPGFANIETGIDASLLAIQEDFNQYYLPPKKNKITSERPNLIYIYAESLEQTYFDEKLFPGLVPNLKQLQAENIVFTNIDQVVGDGFTIAGITTTQCGVPLFSSSGDNSMGGMEHFYEGAYSLGKFLASENFTLVYRGGASLEFAGKGKFYKTHGFSDVKGREELMCYLKDPSNVSWWGLHDDSMFDIIYDKFIELSKRKVCFGIFTLTLDTHHPNGHFTRSCREIKYQDGSNEILNAVACADHLISGFIRKIQSSEYGKNTVIVLTSDHLAMRNGATSILKKGDRKNLFMIIDPRNKTPRVINKKGSMVDVAATVLYSLGYDTPLGLGRNLQSDSQSLITEIKNYREKLFRWKPIIEKFWNNPKIGASFLIDNARKTVVVNGTSYEYPILIEVMKDREVKPYFEFFEHDKLSSLILKFTAATPFVWVDKCSKIRYLDDRLGCRDGYCVAWGQLGSQVDVKTINKTMLLGTTNLSGNIDKKLSQKKYVDRLYALKRYTYKNRYKDGWSKGKEGGVEIVSIQDERVQLQYWTHNPKKEHYRFEIVLDGKSLYVTNITPFEVHQTELALKEGQHTITLYIEDSFNPYLLKKSLDNRELGVAFQIDRI